MKVLNKFVLSVISVAVLTSCNNSETQLIQPVNNTNISANSIDNNFVALGDSKLQPDGESKFEWTVKLTDKNGQPLANTDVNFSVQPLNPLSGWRNVEEVAKRYGSSAAKLKSKVADGSIRLIGTVNPKVVKTNSQGIAKTVYTTSHIGGNENEKGSEKIIAQYKNGNESETLENKVEIGYDDLIPLPTVEGGLRIGDVTGKHLQKDIADLLLNVGNKIKNEKWGQPLTITAGTLKWGGLYPPHFTHRRGGTFDFRPMSTDGEPTFCNPNGTFAPNYDRAKTLELIKIFKQSGATEIIFNDPEAWKIGAKQLAGHHNHLHVSWLESESRIVTINKTVK